MRHRQLISVRIENHLNRRMNALLRSRGWTETIIPYTGYGNEDHLRVLGRIVLRPARPRTYLGRYAENLLNQRGWRNFLSIPVPHGQASVRVDGDELSIRADPGGYFDLTVRTTALKPGWRTVLIDSPGAEPVEEQVLIVSSAVTFGLISDIDDTILSTWLPRLFLAGYNSFVQTEGNRQAVPGMARMYQKLLATHPGAPIVYVSTGAWNTLPFLRRFMTRHGFPAGPMLLTDWGPTNTGFFRSGPDHKRYSIGELARDFPNIRWILIGDNGQLDPALYREFAELNPDRVRAIAIRQLSPPEQVLAHGTTTLLQNNLDLRWTPPPVPVVTGDDGDELSRALASVLPEEAAVLTAAGPVPRRG